MARGRRPQSTGELNNALTRLCIDFVAQRGGKSYAAFNDVVGALELMKVEFIRRMVNAYEDEKIAANGDVYP